MSRVIFRPIEVDDLNTMLVWRNTYSVYKWCRQAEPISWREHLAWFDSLQTRKDIRMYAVLNDKHNIVGVCGLTSIDLINSRAEFSLYIGPEHQGKGSGESALRMILDIGFNVHNLNMIYGESFKGNPAMCLLKKIGFEYEGDRRSFYYRDGKYVDASLWSIVKNEFISNRSK